MTAHHYNPVTNLHSSCLWSIFLLFYYPHLDLQDGLFTYTFRLKFRKQFSYQSCVLHDPLITSSFISPSYECLLMGTNYEAFRYANFSIPLFISLL